MAAQRELYCRSSNGRGRSLEVWLHFDTDVDRELWPADDVGPPDADLLELEVHVAGGTFDYTIWRPVGNSRNPWRSGTLTPGEHRQALGTGQMRTIADLAGWSHQVIG